MSSRRSSLLYDAEFKHWICNDEIRKGDVKHVQITSLLLHCRDFPFYMTARILPHVGLFLVWHVIWRKELRIELAYIGVCVCFINSIYYYYYYCAGYFILLHIGRHNRLVQFRIPAGLHVWLRDMFMSSYIALHTSIWALSHTNCPTWKSQSAVLYRSMHSRGLLTKRLALHPTLPHVECHQPTSYFACLNRTFVI